MPSPFYPWLNTMPLIDYAIQVGRGAAAAVVGQTYDVRRLTDTTNVSVSSNDPVFTQFPARLERTTSKVLLENQIFELMVFKSTCDNRELVLMDQLTETGYEAMAQGVYIFAQARPTRETIFMRAESNITISRPMPTSLAASTQPISGTTYIGDGAWSGVWKEGDQPLTLINGMYGFATVDLSGMVSGASVVFGGSVPANASYLVSVDGGAWTANASISGGVGGISLSAVASAVAVAITGLGLSGVSASSSGATVSITGADQLACSVFQGATPAQIQCGLVPNARIRDGNTLNVPTEQYRDQFLAYLPMLPGVMLNELDRLNFGQGDRYEIAKFFTTDLTGLAGQFMMLEKLGGS